jgi:hypothetical protein
MGTSSISARACRTGIDSHTPNADVCQSLNEIASAIGSGPGDRRTPQLIASLGVLAHIGSHGANRDRLLCQNCVRYPPKPWGNTVIYGDTLKEIVVAGCR